MVSVLAMPEESPYVKLGDVEPVNLLQFAHQIASGMDMCLHRQWLCKLCKCEIRLLVRQSGNLSI
jgi:hypothetical protein